MSSTYSVTANHWLRNLYTADRTLAVKSNRQTASVSALTAADQQALRNGIRALASYSYDNGSKDDTSSRKTDFYRNLKAFADAYNYTIDSGTSSGDSTLEKITKKIKTLSKKYSDQLGDYGVSFNSAGYMSVKSSAVNNIKVSNFEDTFGSDSEYMKQLDKYASSIASHINLTV